MDNIKTILRDIGYFFYDRESGDVVEKVNGATKKLKDIGITDISLNGEVLSIRVIRPGLLVGRKGETITALTEYLKGKSKVSFSGIKIVEDVSLSNLYSFQIALDYL